MEAEDTIQKDDDNGLRSVFAQKVELVTRVDLLNEGAKTYLASATSPYPNSVAHGQMSSSTTVPYRLIHRVGELLCHLTKTASLQL